MVVTIRLYKQRDKKRILKFMKSVDRDFNPPIDSREGGLKKYLDYVLDKKYRIYILETYKFFLFFPKIIGVVMTFDEGKNTVIKYLAVAKEYREHGHGSDMIEMALLDIKKSGKVMLRTWLTNNVALSLYKKFGFRFCKIQKDKDRLGKDKSVYMKLEEDDFENFKNR